MPHAHYVTDENGECTDMVWFCSDSCNRSWSGDSYQGWAGCLEIGDIMYCAECGVVMLPPAIYTYYQSGYGPDVCSCMIEINGQSRLRVTEGIYCPHGNRLQAPRFLLSGYERAVERGEGGEELEIERRLQACGCERCSGPNRACRCEQCLSHRRAVANGEASEQVPSITIDNIDVALGLVARRVSARHGGRLAAPPGSHYRLAIEYLRERG